MSTAEAFFASQMKGEGEAWRADHNQAMQCRELEEHLRKGVSLFYFYRLADEAWSRKVQAGTDAFDAERLRLIRDEYLGWLAPCDRLLELLGRIEQHFHVENAEQFRSCVRLARKLVAVDVEELIESVGQAARNEVQALTDELWDDALPRGDNA